ncbi:MAG TPA: M48 family metalloprotease [Nevskiaceae bacterium]|nr:M48 family metalloprotease [Nevskiaceae bacterium]
MSRSVFTAALLLGLSTLASAQRLEDARPVRPDAPSVEDVVVLRQPLDLPQMGEPADATLSPAEELALGSQVVSQMYQYEYVFEDAEVSDYIAAMGWKLAAAGQTRPDHLAFLVIADPRINAFALPGGYIGMNAGLITASSSESELAGVMGHELAHVTQRHIARSASASGGLATVATWAAVLAAILAGSGDPDVVLAALSVGTAASYQRQVSFIRAHELEADRIGIQTLAAAGYNPEGMANFFQRLEQQSRLYGTGIPEILRTHPVNTTRISEARARIAALPARTVPDSLDYQLMKARTQVFAADQPSAAVAAFSARLEAGEDSPATRYGLALAQHQLGQAEAARRSLDPVLQRHPRQAHLNLLRAAIDFSGGAREAALNRYAETLKAYPRFAPAILAYADALIQAGRAPAARDVLLSHEQALGTRLETYRLLASAARETDDNGEASFQMANYLYLRGDPGGALAQLDAGLRIASLSPQDRARLAARRSEVRDALPRNFDPYRRPDQRRLGSAPAR